MKKMTLALAIFTAVAGLSGCASNNSDSNTGVILFSVPAKNQGDALELTIQKDNGETFVVTTPYNSTLVVGAKVAVNSDGSVVNKSTLNPRTIL